MTDDYTWEDILEYLKPTNYYDAGGYELRKVLQAYGLVHFAYRYNVVQYLMRAHTKHRVHAGSLALEIADLEKAREYLDWEIERMKSLEVQKPIDD